MPSWKRWAVIGSAFVLGVPALLCGGSGLIGATMSDSITIRLSRPTDEPALWRSLRSTPRGCARARS